MQNKRVKALCRCFWLHLNQIILAEKIQIQDTGAKICCFGKYAFGHVDIDFCVGASLTTILCCLDDQS